jgi:serralysin
MLLRYNRLQSRDKVRRTSRDNPARNFSAPQETHPTMPTPSTSSQVSQVALTGVRNIDSLIYGYKWGGSTAGQGITLEYSFGTATSVWSTAPQSQGGYGAAVSGGGDPWTGYAPLTAAQTTAARAALQQWANVANIRFVEVGETASSVGDIRFAQTTHTDGDESAHAGLPGGGASGGDVWLQKLVATNSQVSPGQFGYKTLLHEVGHALGLKHPFETSQFSFSTLSSSFDSADFTLMSYNVAENKGISDWNASFYPTTPGTYDIAAIQYLYGANTSYRAGNDTYTFVQGRDYSETIWDGGGVDTIVWSATTQAAAIDLTPGSWSSLGNALVFTSNRTGERFSQSETVRIYGAVTIENATGGAAADTLTGNSADNVLDGGGGADTMKGGAGNDTYVVDATGDTVTELAGEGTDLVRASVNYVLPVNVEQLSLTGSATTGTGSSLANTIIGNALDNSLTGGGGNDILRGGEGSDTAVFSGAMASYSLGKVGSSVVVNGADGADILESIEMLKFGSADAVAVSSLSLGPTTVPIITVTRDGTTGYEVATPFSGTPIAGVRIDYQFLGGSSGEVAVGTDSNDFFNLLAGDDAAAGGAGADILDGGIGSNFLSGNAGTDTFFLDGRGGTVTWSTITDWSAGEQLSVWGWKANSKVIVWRQDGAAGFQGITMHADLNNDGTIDTSVTWTGKTQAELPTPGQFAAQDLLWFT